MDHPSLNVSERMSGISLVPMAVKGLGRDSELHNEIAGEVLRLGFAALLSPEAEQRIFIMGHDEDALRPPLLDVTFRFLSRYARGNDDPKRIITHDPKWINRKFVIDYDRTDSCCARASGMVSDRARLTSRALSTNCQ